ncbi:hypothetical protein PMAYCL1PPCAC_03928, partial [Pristionchus mayeri]
MDKLLSLPPMEKIFMEFRIPQVNADQFLHLLSLHKFIHFYYSSVVINGDELKRAMEMISTEIRERAARVRLNATMVSNWLRSEGFSDSSKAGDTCREFELVKIPDEYDNSLSFRYRRCYIRIYRFDWTSSTFNNIILMTNREETM